MKKKPRSTIAKSIRTAATDRKKLEFAIWGKDGIPLAPFPTVEKYLRKGDWLRRCYKKIPKKRGLPMDYERLTRLRELTNSGAKTFEIGRGKMVLEFAQEFLVPLLEGDEKFFRDVAGCIKTWKTLRGIEPYADRLSVSLLVWKRFSTKPFSMNLFRKESPFFKGVPDRTIERRVKELGLPTLRMSASAK